MLAEFGTGQVFWSMLWFFLWFIWIYMLIVIFGDIFRSRGPLGLGQGAVVASSSSSCRTSASSCT